MPARSIRNERFYVIFATPKKLFCCRRLGMEGNLLIAAMMRCMLFLIFALSRDQLELSTIGFDSHKKKRKLKTPFASFQMHLIARRQFEDFSVFLFGVSLSFEMKNVSMMMARVVGWSEAHDWDFVESVKIEFFMVSDWRCFLDDTSRWSLSTRLIPNWGPG